MSSPPKSEGDSSVPIAIPHGVELGHPEPAVVRQIVERMIYVVQKRDCKHMSAYLFPMAPIAQASGDRYYLHSGTFIMALFHAILWFLSLYFATMAYYDVDDGQKRAPAKLLEMCIILLVATISCVIISASWFHWTSADTKYLANSVPIVFARSSLCLGALANLTGLLVYAQGLILFWVYELDQAQLNPGSWTPLQSKTTSKTDDKVNETLYNGTLALAFGMLALGKLSMNLRSYTRHVYDD
jgi:hypothetical protein